MTTRVCKLYLRRGYIDNRPGGLDETGERSSLCLCCVVEDVSTIDSGRRRGGGGEDGVQLTVIQLEETN